ncbi:MAG TPA: sigma-70 family RNA polymerase sigma factor [Gemmataceae bacterium]|nr:sigma-70 family RNA polymerase sigma factor [Gemmataceae bacterium]
MATSGTGGLVLRYLRKFVGRRSSGQGSDAHLLERFTALGDEEAFRALVERLGPTVLGVCRRMLRQEEDAEDAFQATFLVLARKAGTLHDPDRVSSWLYGVACRTAARAKVEAAKRRVHERQVMNRTRETKEEVDWRDVRPVLDEEIQRLPAKYRLPFLLCYLEGHTNEEAAQKLGCPKGTVLSRLAWARQRLRDRLTRRGLTLSAAALAGGLADQTTWAAVPPALLNATVKAVLSSAGQTAASGAVSANVAGLSEGVLQMMFLARLKITAIVCLVLTVALAGTGVFLYQGFAREKAGDPPQAAPAVAASSSRAEDDKNREVRRELIRNWQEQQARFVRGRFEVDRYEYTQSPHTDIPREQVLKLIEALDVADFSKFAEQLAALLPPLEVAIRRGNHMAWPARVEVYVDGKKCRNDRHHENELQGKHDVIQISNGADWYDFGSYRNSRGDIKEAGIRKDDPHIDRIDVAHLRFLPLKPESGLDQLQEVSRAEGRVTLGVGARGFVDPVKREWTFRLVADEKTGFVRHWSAAQPAGPQGKWSSWENNVWQAGPVEGRKEIVYPTVHIEASFVDGMLYTIDILHVTQAEPDAEIPASTFTLSVPAGTQVKDIRAQPDNSATAVTTEPVADVLAFANRMPAKNRAIWPTVKPGQEAPPIRPATWLNKEGKIDPPDLKGKVVLLYFWDKESIVTIRELQIHQDFAQRLAKKGVVLAGLHKQGVPDEELQSLVQRVNKSPSSLPDLLAIDRPAAGADPEWLGATFEAYGVHGIPNAALIDRQNRIVYVGGFEKALQKAAVLVGESIKYRTAPN